MSAAGSHLEHLRSEVERDASLAKNLRKAREVREALGAQVRREADARLGEKWPPSPPGMDRPVLAPRPTSTGWWLASPLRFCLGACEVMRGGADSSLSTALGLRRR